MLKKLSILMITILILIMLSSTPALAVTAADNGQLKVYTVTDGGYEGDWLRGFDVKGYVNSNYGGKQVISSTFGDYGYHVFLNVNGTNGVMTGELSSTDLVAKLKNMHYTQVGGTQVINGIQLGVATSFINEGKHIKITYNLKNTTATNAKISLATTADVEIDGDDDAKIKRLANGNGVLLYTPDGDVSGKPVQFAFYGKGVTGTTAIDSLWIGSWGSTYFKNMFNNNPSVTEVENRDSAFAYAWINRDIAAGATQTYSVLMEVGEVNIPLLELTTPNNATLYADEAIIKGIVRDSDLIDTAIIHYKLDNGTEVTLPAIAMNGTAKNFSIDLRSLNLAIGSTHTIKVWATDGLNMKSNEETITFKIKEVRPPVINIAAGEWLKENAKFNLTDTLNTATRVQKYEYKLDNGAWKTATLSTDYVALTASGTTTISARTVGVSGETSDIVTKVIKLDNTVPTVAFNTNEGAISIVGTDVNSGVATVQYLWSDSDQTPAANAVWSNYTSELKYTGNLTDTIYLWTKVTDKAGNVTVSSKTINSVKAPNIIAESEFKQENAKFKLTDTQNNPSNVGIYQYKINDGEWLNCYKDTLKEIDGLTGNITIYARTIDNVGRASAEVSKVVKVTITQPIKDSTPKTGNVEYTNIVLLSVIILSTIGMITVIKIRK